MSEGLTQVTTEVMHDKEKKIVCLFLLGDFQDVCQRAIEHKHDSLVFGLKLEDALTLHAQLSAELQAPGGP